MTNKQTNKHIHYRDVDVDVEPYLSKSKPLHHKWRKILCFLIANSYCVFGAFSNDGWSAIKSISANSSSIALTNVNVIV